MICFGDLSLLYQIYVSAGDVFINLRKKSRSAVRFARFSG